MVRQKRASENVRDKEIAVNCFAYRKEDCSCRALKCLDCRKCKFFKTKNKFNYDLMMSTKGV